MIREHCDILIIGSGVMGLATGIALLDARPNLKVVIAEKEADVAIHASGRNSGVLHAGFYYSPESLKAKFCRDGNREIRALAKRYQIEVQPVGKVVVAKNAEENKRLDELLTRGLENGVELEILPEKDLPKFEPFAKTYERFLWSPSTAISNSQLVVNAMRKEFESRNGSIVFGSSISLKEHDGEIFDRSGQFSAQHFINTAGAQSDRISRAIGVGTEYAMIPFMGVYKATTKEMLPLSRLVYPVPHPINPFLGVHFTLTLDGKVKIGPTAIPILGREQYSIKEGWSFSDLAQSAKGLTSLARGKHHDLSKLVRSEMPRFLKSVLIRESAELVPSASSIRSWKSLPPGIRAQLIHLPTGKLEQDFIVTSKLNSTHVLNAVSPGWTSALPFGRHIEKIIPSV